MEKSHIPMILTFSLPYPFWYNPQCFLEILPLPHFSENLFPPFKKRMRLGGEKRTLCILLKVYFIIFDYFLCYSRRILILFECFYCYQPFPIWFLRKFSELLFLWPNKTEGSKAIEQEYKTHGNFSNYVNL